MALTKYSKAEKQKQEAEALLLQEWLKDNAPKPGAPQVGGPGMVVDRDTAVLQELKDMRDAKAKRLADIQANLLDPDNRLPAADFTQKLDEGSGIVFGDPNAKRANTLAEALSKLSTTVEGGLPDMGSRAGGNLLAGTVAQPAGFGKFMQLLRTSVPGMGNQRSLEVLMQQINDAKTAGKIDFDALNTVVANNRTPVPDQAATRAGMEAASAQSNKPLEQILQESLDANRTNASQLAGGERAIKGLAAEARQKIQGRQMKAVTGAGVAALTAYGVYGPGEKDKMRKAFRDTYYSEGGGPMMGLIEPQDDADYEAAMDFHFNKYRKDMIGEPNTHRSGAYDALLGKHKDTIAGLGRGDISLTSDEPGLKEFRRSLADFYGANGYKEDKPLAFPYRDKAGKKAIFMTGKMGDKMARLLAKGEFEMAD